MSLAPDGDGKTSHLDQRIADCLDGIPDSVNDRREAEAALARVIWDLRQNINQQPESDYDGPYDCVVMAQHAVREGTKKPLEALVQLDKEKRTKNLFLGPSTQRSVDLAKELLGELETGAYNFREHEQRVTQSSHGNTLLGGRIDCIATLAKEQQRVVPWLRRIRQFICFPRRADLEDLFCDRGPGYGRVPSRSEMAEGLDVIEEKLTDLATKA